MTDLPINQIICGDCLEVMKNWPDKYVDLMLTDPPYGIDYGKQIANTQERFGWRKYGCPVWDTKRPDKVYFDEMFRISINLIIWGGNYFSDYLYPSQGWLVWNKGQRNFSLADGELAWTSYDKALRIFDYSRAAALQDDKQHPTQKPIALGIWILENYSNPDDLILDCYCGSGSFCIAAKMLGRRYIGIDISPEYCEIARQRLEAVDTGVPVKEQRQGQKALWPVEDKV